jgi:2-iminobutanoate/2-iminopropanoate deaminase
VSWLVGEQTHRVMRNIGRALDDLGLGYDDIIKTTIYLDDIGDFQSVNGVYGVYLSESRPARSTVEVAALPAGFVLEIEIIGAR